MAETLPTMAEVLSSATVRYSPAVLDRALAAHDAQVAAKALRDAARDPELVGLRIGTPAWLNARADAMTRQAAAPAADDDAPCPRCGCPTACPEGRMEALSAELAEAKAEAHRESDRADQWMRAHDSDLAEAEAERDALAAQLDALRGRIEALRDEFRRWVACNEPIAATGGWQASGYMQAYLNRAAVVLDAALAAAPSETEEGR